MSLILTLLLSSNCALDLHAQESPPATTAIPARVSPQPHAAPAGSSRLQLDIIGHWDAQLADVKKVLLSAAQPLWKEFPERDLSPIRVYPRGGPIVFLIEATKVSTP